MLDVVVPVALVVAVVRHVVVLVVLVVADVLDVVVLVALVVVVVLDVVVLVALVPIASGFSCLKLPSASLFVWRAGEKGQQAYADMWEGHLDQIEQDRFSSQPAAVEVTLRRDGKMSTSRGSVCQESKHRHSKKAFSGKIHGIWVAHMLHMSWSVMDNLRNYHRHSDADLCEHWDLELMIEVEQHCPGTYARYVQCMCHVDTQEAMYAGTLLGNGGPELLHGMAVEDPEYDAACEPEVDAPADGAAVPDDPEQRKAGEALSAAAEPFLDKYIAEKSKHSDRAGRGAGPGACTHWLLRSPATVRACLGSPFRHLSEVAMLLRLQPCAPPAGSKRHTWLADRFNRHVASMRAAGFTVQFKTPTHVRKLEADLESAAAGYVEVVQGLGSLGNNFHNIKKKMGALSQNVVPVHTVMHETPVDQVLPATPPPPAVEAPAKAKALPRPPSNAAGKPCVWCGSDLAALGAGTGLANPTKAFSPQVDGIYHTAGHCPREKNKAMPPGMAVPKKVRQRFGGAGSPCAKCNETLVVTGGSSPKGTFGPLHEGYFHTARFCPFKDALSGAPECAKPVQERLSARREHERKGGKRTKKRKAAARDGEPLAAAASPPQAHAQAAAAAGTTPSPTEVVHCRDCAFEGESAIHGVVHRCNDCSNAICGDHAILCAIPNCTHVLCEEHAQEKACEHGSFCSRHPCKICP